MSQFFLFVVIIENGDEIEEINKCNDCFKLFIVNGMSKETTTLL